jgi:hypothetical protein
MAIGKMEKIEKINYVVSLDGCGGMIQNITANQKQESAVSDGRYRKCNQ